MKQPNIVIVGHVCIDHNTVEHAEYTNWGSAAMYITDYMRRTYGIEPNIIASYGTDFAPYTKDVPLYPPAQAGVTTLMYENVVKNGKRAWYCHHNDAHLLPRIDERIRSTVASADILFLAPLTPAFDAAYVTELMKPARLDCLKVLLPQGYLRDTAAGGLVCPREFDEAQEVLPHFNLVILSDEDHPEAIARSREWKRFSPHTEFIVTENANGADIVQASGEVHIPTAPVSPEQIIDSVGCGDVFSAATAYSLFQTGDLPAAIAAGHAAARQKLLTPSPTAAGGERLHVS